MKHRILALLLVLLISATLLCSCFNRHQHEFSDKYTSNETHHWRQCECDEKDGYGEHTFDEGKIIVYPTTESEGQKAYTCTVCSYKRIEPVEMLPDDHTHVYNVEYSDEHSHGTECVCGERGNVSEHLWDGGVVTTPAGEIETGVKTFTCTKCGRKSTENIPATKENGLSFLQSTHYRLSDKLTATPRTVEAMIYLDPSVKGRGGAIFGNYYGIREDWLFEIYDNGVPRFYYSDAAGNIKDIRFNNVDVRTGDWAHVALTFDYENGTISFYLNGEIAQIVLCDLDLADDITRYQFVVGGDNRSNNGDFFHGKIASVAAYSDVRSAEEIAHSAQHGTNLYADDLLVSFLLNEQSAGKDIHDLSVNNHIIQQEWLDSHEPELDYAYSFAVVGDTQWLSKYKPEKMEGIYDWIVANKEDKNILHVFGLGDITEDWNTAGKEAEWIRAQQYIYKLNGVVPYSLVRGNHDESKYFLKYFATEEYMNQLGAEYMVEGDIRNSYKAVTIGSTDYLFLTLDYGASDEILEWANEVVLAYPNHRVIVTTHAYHGYDGGHLNYDNVSSSGNITSGSDVDTSVGDNAGRGYNNGQMIWEKFVSLHPNIFLVMSGHTPLEDVFLLKSEGVHGNIVNQLLIDPQWMDPQKDGVGMVCMLYFSEDGSELEIEWICTDTGKYYKEQNQYAIDLSGSLDVPAHNFYDSYNETYHYKACDCGYVHSEAPHSYDGGTLNAEGFMVYSCECGYQRITSATDDPIALELQSIIEVIYNSGVYFKETKVNSTPITTFYNGDKFWTDNDEECEKTSDYLTLYNLLMGKFGDLRLDIGWNVHEGVYSSVNADTVKGVSLLVLGSEAQGVDKVSVEKQGTHLIITLYANDSVYAQSTFGLYATTTLLLQGGDVLDVIYSKAAANGLCEIITPEISGYVAEYDKIILDSKHVELNKTVYYSTIVTWDGTSVSPSLKGEGTKENPFLVESGADLAYIRDVVNAAGAATPNFSGKYFKLTQSIDLGGHELAIGDYPGWSSRKGFYGFFDGNHCTIRGLNSTKSLFGTIESGYLINLSVYGSINGNSTIGGIVGYVANGGKLENLTNYVTINGVNTLGGIVGNAEDQASTVKDCVNYGNVTATSWIIGGIAGSGGHDVIGCVNYGTVKSNDGVVGGIIGETKNTGSVSNCINYGTIIAGGKTGGIIGQANKPVIGCINYGDVSGVWAVGGVVGFIKGGESCKITDCVNNGNVTASSTSIAGILGLSEDGSGVVTVTGCVNNGSISTVSWGCGGISGQTHGTISNCVNNGAISAMGESGGIVGKLSGNATECTNNGSVNAMQDIVGGIVGHLFGTTNLETINSTNYQNGSVTGPNAQQFVGKID